MKQRWYVVCSEYAVDPQKRERIWTVSRKKNVEGWETDAGCPRYGLTYAQAEELAAAANFCWLGRCRPT